MEGQDRQDGGAVPQRGGSLVRWRRPTIIISLGVALVIAAVASLYSLTYASGSPTISVSPATTSKLWYKPTPFTIQVVASNFNSSLTPISGYQYGLQYDPKVLKWVSGPAVGPGTPTPLSLLPCGQQVITWGTPTATATGFLTWTPTATNTPMTTTPTNTPTATFTPSLTPTPGGYVEVGCATISGSTPVPSAVIGTFQFVSIATAPASSGLNLLNIVAVNHNGTPMSVITPSSGLVLLAACHDLNGDGRVNILDLSLVAAHYNALLGQPNYVAAYDINSDGRINILDLSLVAAGYNQTC